MVSPQSTATGESAGFRATDRGFVTETINPPLTSPAGAAYGSYAQFPGYHYYFWGSVISGFVAAFALGVTSLALMFGCHVGAYSNGALAFGWGAAIWLCVTSCICYYFGGWIASRFFSPSGQGWLRGLTMWGLSVPLLLILVAMLSAGGGLAYGAATHTVTQLTNVTNAAHLSANGDLFMSFGGAWTVFVMLICGLVFSLIGGSTGSTKTQRTTVDAR